MENTSTVLHISDTHLMKDPEAEFLGIFPDKNFRDVLSQAQEDGHTPDLIIHSGDLVQEPSRPAYHRCRELMGEFFPDAPVVATPGNHDNDSGMHAFGGFAVGAFVFSFVGNPWRVMMINTHKKDAVEGKVGAMERDILQSHLEYFSRGTPKHLLIFGHHALTPVGHEGLDQHICTDSVKVMEILSRDYASSVRAYIHGHVHSAYFLKNQLPHGGDVIVAPATSFQFEHTKPGFVKSAAPPGYQWLFLHRDGKIDCETKYLPKDATRDKEEELAPY